MMFLVRACDLGEALAMRKEYIIRNLMENYPEIPMANCTEEFPGAGPPRACALKILHKADFQKRVYLPLLASSQPFKRLKSVLEVCEIKTCDAEIRNGPERNARLSRTECLLVVSRPGASRRRQSRRASRVSDFRIEMASQGQAPRRRSLVQPRSHHHEVTAEIREHGHGLRSCQPRQFARPQYRHLSGEVVCPI